MAISASQACFLLLCCLVPWRLEEPQCGLGRAGGRGPWHTRLSLLGSEPCLQSLACSHGEQLCASEPISAGSGRLAAWCGVSVDHWCGSMRGPGLSHRGLLLEEEEAYRVGGHGRGEREHGCPHTIRRHDLFPVGVWPLGTPRPSVSQLQGPSWSL